MFIANSLSNATVQLSPLFSSANTNDIASVRTRIRGGGRTNITFAASTTNTPTIPMGTTPVSRTISWMYMNNVPVADNIGIRVNSNFNYGSYPG